MAKGNGSTLLTLGLLGAAAYLLYNWWTTNCVAGSAAMSSFPCSMLPAATTAATPVTTVATTTTMPATAVPTNSTPLVPATPATPVNTLASMFAGLQSTVTTAYSGDPALVCSLDGSAKPATCSNPYATYDVFNYYLVAAGVGVSTAPNPPDHSTQLSLSDYWAWAAPELQQAMPGLSGDAALYAGLGAFARGRW